MVQKQSGSDPSQEVESRLTSTHALDSGPVAGPARARKKDKSRAELTAQNENLMAQIRDYERIFGGIPVGEVDAFVVSGPDGDDVLTLPGADLPLRVLVEAMADGAIMFSGDGLILYANPRFSELVGVDAGKIVGDSLSSFVVPADSWRMTDETAQGYKRNILIRSARGNFLQAQLSICPLDKGSSPVFCGIITDLTETLAAAEARLRLAALVESSHDAIIGMDLDAERTIRSWNAGASKLYGYRDAEIRSHSFDVLIPGQSKQEYLIHIENIARGAMLQQFDTVHIRKDGSLVDVSLTLSMLCDADGGPIGISVVARDITERNRAQQSIEAALKKNQVLLQEVHHRVKNNLQVISSLLNLQAEAARDRPLHGMLQQARQRVYSMALIHDQLYQSDNLARIDFGSYARILATDLFETYSVDKTRLSLHLDLEPIHLTLDTAVPCGLILNELVCNSLKHAFLPGSKGSVRVRLTQDNQGQVLLSVQDDGVGFSPDYATKKSLGFRIVTILAGQINGQLSVENDTGGKVVIQFPGS